MSAYGVPIGLGVGAGVLSMVSFHLRNPSYRNAPSFKRTMWVIKAAVWITACVVALLALLAWILGDLQARYLAGGGSFLAVEFVGLFVWPLVRAR